MKAYYISRQGRQEGPHTLEIIEDKIKSHYLNEKDYIYDSTRGEWIHLSNFKPIIEMFEQLKKEDFENNGQEKIASEKNWYLLKGNQQMGPYHFKEIVSMLVNKEAFEFDFVWSSGMTAWQKVSECPQFQEGNVLPFVKKESFSSGLHFRRRNERKNFGASLVFHNNKKLWNAKSFEVSASGASIEVVGTSFNRGEILLIHYRPSKTVPAFNVQCEVMNCDKIQDQAGSSVYRLGLRFVKVNDVAHTVLQQLVSHKVAS